MIYLRNTGESFSDIYKAREAVLNFARICDPKEHMKTELVLDAGEYVLSSPLVFSKEAFPFRKAAFDASLAHCPIMPLPSGRCIRHSFTQSYLRRHLIDLNSFFVFIVTVVKVL